jgi:DNA primase
MAQETAHETKRLLDELGVPSYIKTTGNRGLHVYVRLQPEWDSVQVRSRRSGRGTRAGAVDARPDHRSWWKEERGERIFIDFNQNAPHKTVFAPWSVRARDHAPVSCCFAWDDLDRVRPDLLTIANVPERIATDGDPWADIDEHPQSLEPLLELMRRDQVERGLPDAPWPPVYPKMAGEPPRVAPSRAKKPKPAPEAPAPE